MELLLKYLFEIYIFLGVTKLPTNNLSYSLRFPERPRQNAFYKIGGRDWKTDLLYPNYELTGPRFPYSHEGGNDPGDKSIGDRVKYYSVDLHFYGVK